MAFSINIQKSDNHLSIQITELTNADLPSAIAIWNEVVEAGEAFPQEEKLTLESGEEFFAGQSFCGVARENGEIVGLYILHPNNVGRCGHIANASYAAKSASRGRGVGEALVRHSLKTAARLGFKILQFNAVTADNVVAQRLYEKLGFAPLGSIPGGFRAKNGAYKDIRLYWRDLKEFAGA